MTHVQSGDFPSSVTLSKTPSQTCQGADAGEPSPGDILFLTKHCGEPVTLCQGGQMGAVLGGQARAAHAAQDPLPTQPICWVRLGFITQHGVRVLQRDLISLVFLLASRQPSPLREMNLVTAHLCLPLASRVLKELSVCSADDRLGARPGEAQDSRGR